MSVVLSLVQCVASRVSSVSRQRKTQRLQDLIQDGASVLVVGITDPKYSSTSNQIELALATRAVVTGLFYPALKGLGERVPFPLVRGSGLQLPFRDGAFDYVFSNAVIEHVGDSDAQQLFVDESLRVARQGVVHTTPNRWHPVETHTRTLGLHWLPRRYHKRIFGDRTRYKWHDTDRLISGSEFRRLLGPGSTVQGWPAAMPLTYTGWQRLR